MMRTWLTAIGIAGFILATAGVAGANSVASSTMHFEGALTNQGGGVYTGTIAMTDDGYYNLSDGGGFDLYAKYQSTAYVSCYTPTEEVIGQDHDAYNESGDWGAWYDPDCADWWNFSLILTEDSWTLQHIGGGTQAAPAGGKPMSGDLYYSTTATSAIYAEESDVGWHPNPGNDGDAAAHGGGAGAWDCDWNWGSEVIPLQLPGYDVEVQDLGGGDFHVIMTPVPEPATLSLIGLGLAGLLARKRRK